MKIIEWIKKLIKDLEYKSDIKFISKLRKSKYFGPPKGGNQ